MIPTVRRNGKLWLIEPPKSRDRHSFIWDPVLREEAPPLRQVATAVSKHTFGYIGLFKPSIQECEDAMPEEWRRDDIYYEVVGPQGADDLNKAPNCRHHWATLIIYVLEQSTTNDPRPGSGGG